MQKGEGMFALLFVWLLTMFVCTCIDIATATPVDQQKMGDKNNATRTTYIIYLLENSRDGGRK
jgi:hypothetical protein